MLPLVGSRIALPGSSAPRFSASHTIAAPIRHFTEYAGLRPSIFASTVAFAPFVRRLMPHERRAADGRGVVLEYPTHAITLLAGTDTFAPLSVGGL